MAEAPAVLADTIDAKNTVNAMVDQLNAFAEPATAAESA